MSREIKFRAWVPNGLLGHIADVQILDFSRGTLFTGGVSNRDIKDVELMQYTGLKDKHGVEIYEGDILKAGSDVVVVEWHKSKATFCLQKDGWLFAHYFGEAIDADQCEVIGNIWENKELLHDSQ